MLQSKLLMQQQSIVMKQMQVKEIESPKDSATEQVSPTADAQPKFDRYIAEKEDAKNLDNVYHLEEKDGNWQVFLTDRMNNTQ